MLGPLKQNSNIQKPVAGILILLVCLFIAGGLFYPKKAQAVDPDADTPSIGAHIAETVAGLSLIHI